MDRTIVVAPVLRAYIDSRIVDERSGAIGVELRAIVAGKEDVVAHKRESPWCGSRMSM
jgi:hypothetical protein